MAVIPNWFKKDLKSLDPTYFVEYEREYNYFVIKKKLNKLERGRLNQTEVWLATFPILNEDAMTNLRKRKWMGRRFDGNVDKYLNYIKGLDKDSKKKAIQIAQEMRVEGLMKGYQMSRRTYFT